MTMTALVEVSPLWPADLHHIRLDSPDPAALAAFYQRAMVLGQRVAEGHQAFLVAMLCLRAVDQIYSP